MTSMPKRDAGRQAGVVGRADAEPEALESHRLRFELELMASQDAGAALDALVRAAEINARRQARPGEKASPARRKAGGGSDPAGR